ncbi:MAG: GAF domain-containing protein [Alphaproteobacteria bacterium]|nr:GAF domain-containing protein [Alphaproteobacteria bacterium]
MVEALTINKNLSKAEIYEEILPQIKAITEGEENLVANLANIAAILNEAFGHLWTGFYLRDGKTLVLGPFQGPLACTRIPVEPVPRGVCGTAAVEMKTLIVPDVEKFAGHIACSSLSRSEIVVPLIHNGRTELVLDVDSINTDMFDETDQKYLEQLMAVISKNHFVQ